MTDPMTDDLECREVVEAVTELARTGVVSVAQMGRDSPDRCPAGPLPRSAA